MKIEGFFMSCRHFDLLDHSELKRKISIEKYVCRQLRTLIFHRRTSFPVLNRGKHKYPLSEMTAEINCNTSGIKYIMSDRITLENIVTGHLLIIAPVDAQIPFR
jgi:hypothetical protein